MVYRGLQKAQRTATRHKSWRMGPLTCYRHDSSSRRSGSSPPPSPSPSFSSLQIRSREEGRRHELNGTGDPKRNNYRRSQSPVVEGGTNSQTSTRHGGMPHRYDLFYCRLQIRQNSHFTLEIMHAVGSRPGKPITFLHLIQ